MWRNKSLALILAGFFLMLDQLLKFYATNIWREKNLFNNFFGWHPFENIGAAFGLPVPMIMISTISIIIIFFFIFLLARGEFKQNNFEIFTSLSLATAGALSNLIDRIFYGHTIDYILIFTGIINLADCLIVLGVIGFIYFSKHFENQK